jgi:hypothetical protein
VLTLDIEYRLLQKDSIVGNSCLIALFQETAQEALIKCCETSETTDWSTPYSAAPWETENPAITVAIALSLKFSKSLMASSAGTPIVVTQFSTFRCDGLSDAVELRDWSDLLRLVKNMTAPAAPATTTQARMTTNTRLVRVRVRGEVPSDSGLLSLTLTRCCVSSANEFSSAPTWADGPRESGSLSEVPFVVTSRIPLSASDDA